MLGFLFGFNARIGRLHFFCSTLVVTIMMVVVYAAAIAYAFQTAPKGTVPSPTSGPIFAAAIFFAWLTVTLQSMRFRDIGWDPVCVMPAWIAVAIVDGLVATKFPAMSLGHERCTMVGALVNLSLFLALLFCPSGADDSPAPTPDDRFRAPDPPSPHPVVETLAAPQISRPANGGFGRRGL
ncbi:DUF805 domain-containing protein [Bradyrhizobium paxllaeri]|uniref:DUF805 domain-containing protein n=1 Tax=Bradyrhizobium paxllaeri TaxID=190148 RepID=UPI0008108C63|nr:DUF805 domain-containing protein [Bradyrhizobium paxllaeri]